MKVLPSLAAICALPLFVLPSYAESTGSAFYGDAPDANHPWAVHDRNRPQPAVVTPGTFSSQEQPGKPPSDAVILFDGTESSLSKWASDKNPAEATKWIVKDGTLQCVPGSGYVRTKEEFGDCQLHVEWTEPTDITGESQGRGNSGIFLMGMTEVQVLDNYKNPTYADGSAGSVYGVNPPMANPLRPPGEWQNYDIVFRRPVYKDGKEVEAGTVTVFVNGVLVQDHTPLEGGGGHKSRSKPRAFPETGPLKLQDHGNPVKYRNIWYRPLPARAIEGGTNGYLTEEAATAKRKEIAEGIRGDAAKLEGNAKLLRLMESLSYENDAATLKQSEQLLGQYVESLKAVTADKMESKKGEVLQFHGALEYLAKFKIVPDTFAPKVELAKLVKDHEWDKKK
ncbi:MAG: hypothetical protein RL693_2687 [Verrucomicrobiota bacterium]|jgi:hypothetical protein